jgi:cation diffusion facilitator family transporter
MHTQDLGAWTHSHQFHQTNDQAERGTRWVLWLTAVMMVVEIVAGWWFNSMALLADGWHMSSHTLAIGLSVLAYTLSRRHAVDKRYAFGTWKIEVLGGFASAICLLMVAGLMAWSSMERLVSPVDIHYPEALSVAVLGLLVNLLSAKLLDHDHAHGHSHGHDHGHTHDHAGHDHESKDLNLHAARLHVLADALTSVLAILALLAGWWFKWQFLDPLMGIVGAVMVAAWAKGLVKETSAVLLDREMDHPVVAEIREVIDEQGAAGDTRLSDLHVWRVSQDQYACALSLVTHDHDLTPTTVRQWLSIHEELAHCTVEIQQCPGGPHAHHA